MTLSVHIQDHTSVRGLRVGLLWNRKHECFGLNAVGYVKDRILSLLILWDFTLGLLNGFGIFRFFMGMAKITTPISNSQMAGFLQLGMIVLRYYFFKCLF